MPDPDDTSPDAPRADRPVMPALYNVPEDADGLLPWRHAEERLESARNYWLATTRPDGRPHVRPVFGVWLGAVLYFDGFYKTRWARNFTAHPVVEVHLESGDEVVIVEGEVDDFTPEPELAAHITAAFAAKYDGYRVEADDGVYRLRPRLALAWSVKPIDGVRWKNATRWRFPSE